jgi:signal transduction histidine kinase
MQQPRRILLVEDSATQAYRLRGVLQSDDIDIVHVPSAEAALERLRSARVDLIVLDYHLPGMNGDDFCREIRMNVNTRSIPILMLTSDESTGAEMRGLESGADDYLSKSADADVLQLRMRALLRKSEGASDIVESEQQFRPARVLAINASPTFLHLLSKDSHKQHFVLETARTAEEGLGKISASAFDCVMVDFDLAGETGAELCRSIRTLCHDRQRDVVLIVLTSREDKEHLALALGAGADDYITKTSDIALTNARIRALLRRKLMVEENRRILSELRDKELQALRAEAEKDAAEMRATLADQLAAANQQLEKANRQLEQFASAAAHDLQEPLRMVSIYSQLLQRRCAGQLDARAQQYLAWCVEGTTRMQQMISHLLSYARATRSQQAEASAADLNQVVSRTLSDLRRAIEESHAVVEAAADLPTVAVEEIAVQQVLRNLVSNAIKYRQKGVAPVIRITANRRNDEWIIAVQDNGIGIEPDYTEKVFDAFTRVHKGSYPGTGLGLAICHRIVQHHGGRIWVESQPGLGSTFFFTLPVIAEDSHEVRAGAGTIEPH